MRSDGQNGSAVGTAGQAAPPEILVSEKWKGTSEAEAAYIHVLKDGSPQEAKKAKDVLVIRNMRLVAHIAKKYQNAEEDMEDLISIGTIGLIKAVDTFDAGKGSRRMWWSR